MKVIHDIKLNLHQLFYVITLIGTSLIIYRFDFLFLLNESLKDESQNYILIIPFLFLYLVYLKKDIIKSNILHDDGLNYYDVIFGLVIIFISLIFYWYGSHKFNSIEYHILSIPILFIGISLILFNQNILISLLQPILFLIFLIPIPSSIVYGLGGYLAYFNTLVSYKVLSILNFPVSLSYEYGPPSLVLESLIDPSLTFSIDIPCSGIYTIISYIVFTVFLVTINKSKLDKKILLFFTGFIIFDILNIIRIIIIITIAHYYGAGLAMQTFHVIGGAVFIFIGMIITFYLAKHKLNMNFFETKTKADQCDECSSVKQRTNFCINCGRFTNSNKVIPINSTFYLKIISLLLLCIISVNIINPSTSFSNNSGVNFNTIDSLENATNVLPTIPEYNLMYLYRDEAFETRANQDASMLYAYHPKQIPSEKSSIFVTISVADTLSDLHSWEVCLISLYTSQGKQSLVDVLKQEDVLIEGNSTKTVRYLVFRDENNVTQSVIYWYEKAAFDYGVTVIPKYVRTSLINYNTNSDLDKTKNELVNLGSRVIDFWTPNQNQVLYSLGIPTLQISLIALSLIATLFRSVQYIQNIKKVEKNHKVFLKLASEKDKKILGLINTYLTEKRVSETHQLYHIISQTEDLTLDEFYTMLIRYEQNRLVKRKIIDEYNIPKMVWEKQ